MNWCSVFLPKKADFPFPRWLSHRMRTEQSQGTHSRLYFGPASCHNSHQGGFTHSFIHLSLQQKWDSLPFASLHSGEEPTAPRDRRRRVSAVPDWWRLFAAEIYDSPSGRTDHTPSLASQHEPEAARRAAESVSQALPHR